MVMGVGGGAGGIVCGRTTCNHLMRRYTWKTP